MKKLSRDEIIALVRKIKAAEGTEAEIDAMIAQLRSGVTDPKITDHIFFDELTPEEIADKALAYRPICL